MSNDLMVGDIEQELAGTRRVLERVPDEHLEWRRDETSMTLGVYLRLLDLAVPGVCGPSADGQAT